MRNGIWDRRLKLAYGAFVIASRPGGDLGVRIAPATGRGEPVAVSPCCAAPTCSALHLLEFAEPPEQVSVCVAVETDTWFVIGLIFEFAGRGLYA